MVDIISISLKHSGLQIGIYILAALIVIAICVFIYYQRWFFYFYLKVGVKGTVYYHLHRMIKSVKKRNESPYFYLNKYFASFEFLAEDSNTIQELDARNFWHMVYLNYTDDFIESLTRDKIGIEDIEYFEKKIFDVPLQKNEIPSEKNSNTADISQEKMNETDPQEEEKSRILNACIKQAIIWSSTSKKKNWALLVGNMLFVTGLMECDTDSDEATAEQFAAVLNADPASKGNISFSNVGYIRNFLFLRDGTSLEYVEKKLKKIKKFFERIEFEEAIQIINEEIQTVVKDIEDEKTQRLRN